MADVEMKDSSSKPAAEEDKKDSTQQEEPSDNFYGKCTHELRLWRTNWCSFCENVDIKKSLVILEKAGKEKDFKTCASLTK